MPRCAPRHGAHGRVPGAAGRPAPATGTGPAGARRAGDRRPRRYHLRHLRRDRPACPRPSRGVRPVRRPAVPGGTRGRPAVATPTGRGTRPWRGSEGAGPRARIRECSWRCCCAAGGRTPRARRAAPGRPSRRWPPGWASTRRLCRAISIHGTRRRHRREVEALHARLHAPAEDLARARLLCRAALEDAGRRRRSGCLTWAASAAAWLPYLTWPQVSRVCRGRSRHPPPVACDGMPARRAARVITAPHRDVLPPQETITTRSWCPAGAHWNRKSASVRGARTAG
jgi:hypothetical protein